MFFIKFKELCDKMNTTPTTVIKELGYSTNKVTAWKNGSIPNLEIASKVAQYFNVSTDYLLTGIEPLPKELTQEQQDLLKLYDTLTEVQKAEIKGYMKGLMSK